MCLESEAVKLSFAKDVLCARSWPWSEEELHVFLLFAKRSCVSARNIANTKVVAHKNLQHKNRTFRDPQR